MASPAAVAADELVRRAAVATAQREVAWRVDALLAQAGELQSRLDAEWQPIAVEPAGPLAAAKQVHAAATEALAAAVEAELLAGTDWPAIAAQLGMTTRRAKQMFAVREGVPAEQQAESGDTALAGDSAPVAEGGAEVVDPIGWRFAVPEAVAIAVQAVVDAVEVEPISSPGSSVLAADLRRWLKRLVATVNSDNGEGLRRELRWLLATPMNAGDLLDTPVFVAVRELAKASTVLLQCPSCGYKPGTEPAERSRHLEYLDMLWLDMVGEQVVLRRHCIRCEPTGIVGVSLSCPVCDEGYLLERVLATANADGRLPAPLLGWLANAGWHVDRTAGGSLVTAHRACAAALAGPGRRAPLSSTGAHSA
ncbi:hypothetical protein [Kutzneria buriramensis]|uniref:hypothetical protein n=1 Tax=Kutzneria buriramensis TaxID=1045776 RepID=UPI000E22348E|nr:hypothetical protein [Kutzneria buriramensis]